MLFLSTNVAVDCCVLENVNYMGMNERLCNTARELSKVGPLNGTSALSYSGFFTVNKTYNSNMFFWFFPSQVSLILLHGFSAGFVLIVDAT